MNSVTATAAKKIGELMDQVVQSGQPVAIRRTGRPQVVVVPWRKWNRACYLTKMELGQPEEEARGDLMLTGSDRARAAATG